MNTETKSSATLTPKKLNKKKDRISKSYKSGLTFPVGRVHRLIITKGAQRRIGAETPIYLAAVLEYLAAEIVELAGNASTNNKTKRITPRHVFLAISNDNELSQLFASDIIAHGGVVPHIHSMLLPKRKAAKEE